MKINSFLLFSGADVPFVEEALVIRQPTLKEIGLMGEESFFRAFSLLTFSKDLLEEQEENAAALEEVDDFIFLLYLLSTNTTQLLEVQMLLTLLFPNFKCEIMEDEIALIPFEEGEVKKKITKESFPVFKKILKEIFYLGGEKEPEYNPANETARKIAEKLKKGREAAAKAKKPSAEEESSTGALEKLSMFLSIGLGVPIPQVLDYTVYQLQTSVSRYQAKEAFEVNLQARLAGASDLKEAPYWIEE